MPFEFNYDDARELAAVKVNTMTHAELAEYVLHDLCNLYKEKPWRYLDDKRKYHKELNEQVKTPKVISDEIIPNDKISKPAAFSEATLLQIIKEYCNFIGIPEDDPEEPLDGDAVDEIVEKLRQELNGHQGNT